MFETKAFLVCCFSFCNAEYAICENTRIETQNFILIHEIASDHSISFTYPKLHYIIFVCMLVLVYNALKLFVVGVICDWTLAIKQMGRESVSILVISIIRKKCIPHIVGCRWVHMRLLMAYRT